MVKWWICAVFRLQHIPALHEPFHSQSFSVSPICSTLVRPVGRAMKLSQQESCSVTSMPCVVLVGLGGWGRRIEQYMMCDTQVNPSKVQCTVSREWLQCYVLFQGVLCFLKAPDSTEQGHWVIGPLQDEVNESPWILRNKILLLSHFSIMCGTERGFWVWTPAQYLSGTYFPFACVGLSSFLAQSKDIHMRLIGNQVPIQ